MTALRIKDRPRERMKLRERMAYYNVPGFSIAIIDQDGSTATLVFGADVGQSLDGTGKVLTLTINTFVFASGGTTIGIQPSAQIQSVSGFQGDDGLPINVAGSGGGRVFGGF